MKDTWDAVDFFEKLISGYAGSKYAVAVDSCTNALFLSAKYCYKEDICTKQDIFIPKQTYISVAQQIIHAGYKIKFTDLKWKGYYKLDPLPIVDSAQRFTSGMYIKDTFYCLSFNFKKILSTGRGGMILTDDKKAYEWFKRMRYDGRGSYSYNQLNTINCKELGYHMYMTPDQAMRGIQDFYRLDFVNQDKLGSEDYKVDLSKLECFKDDEKCNSYSN